MHIVELLEGKFSTYHVRDETELISEFEIRHFNQWNKQIKSTLNWFPLEKELVTVAITSGASCPDTIVDEVIMKICSYFKKTRSVEDALAEFRQE